MLRTGLLAFPALDTFICVLKAMTIDQPVLLTLCRIQIMVERQVIHGRKGTGNTDIHRTYLGAVITCRTWNQWNIL